MRVREQGVEFSVYSENASGMELCLFDKNGKETSRLPMTHTGQNLFSLFVDRTKPGQRYGYRAFGEWRPMAGQWFDPAKLLVDPYAKEIDGIYRYDKRLGAFGIDTADLVPKSVVVADIDDETDHVDLPEGGFIYEAGVKALTMLKPACAGKRSWHCRSTGPSGCHFTSEEDRR